jgi:hypothetical protein
MNKLILILALIILFFTFKVAQNEYKMYKFDLRKAEEALKEYEKAKIDLGDSFYKDEFYKKFYWENYEYWRDESNKSGFWRDIFKSL